MQVQPYLFFDGRCEEALEFYKTALGAEVEMLMRFSEGPPADEGGCPDGETPPGGKVMHACFRVGETAIMASDGMCQGSPKFEGISLSISADSDAEAERLFAALGEGGQVQMPMGETFFASRFGMVADRFGVSWMVLAEKEES